MSDSAILIASTLVPALGVLALTGLLASALALLVGNRSRKRP
ncbi:hypothetical protein ACSBLW_13570 [Thioclava sp. FR2]